MMELSNQQLIFFFIVLFLLGFSFTFFKMYTKEFWRTIFHKRNKKKTNTCITCKFNEDGNHCTVGTHYAEKGLSAVCYEGELWEKK